MGKKIQGAALRAKKRQQEQLEALQEQQAEQVARQTVADQANQDLFVLDTTGDNVPRNQQSTANKKDKKKKSKETVWSERERQEIEKLVQRHSKEQLATMAAQGQASIDPTKPLRTHGIRKAKATASNNFDLWEDKKSESLKKGSSEPVPSVLRKEKVAGIVVPFPAKNGSVSTVAKSNKVKGVAVAVAQGGQSYRPDPNEHLKVLKEAVAVEDRRSRAEKEKNDPISPGMSEATKALLLSDSDSSDEEKDEEEKDNEEAGTSTFHKNKDKLTRAQRNKQKRVRQREVERLQAKRRKQNENLVFQAGKFRKELNQKETSLKERQEERQKRAQEKAQQDQAAHVEKSLSEQDPLVAPSYPVALSSELQDSSLRTMIPKGDLVTDRMASYAFRSLAPKLPSKAAAHKAKLAKQRTRPKKKVKGAHEWQGKDFVIIK